MRIRLVIYSVLIMLFILTGCSTNSNYDEFEKTLSKDQALKQLEQMNLPFNARTFIQCSTEGDTSAVKVFLDAGMDINVVNKETTALIEAARKSHIDIVKLLLERGVDVNWGKDGKGTALYWAVMDSYSKTEEIVALLLQHGADVNAKTMRGYTPLMVAPNKEIASMLAESGGDIHARTEENDTVLFKACMNEQVDIVKYLLEKGAVSDINVAENLSQWTPLIAGVESIEIVKLLLENGADVNHRDKINTTALGYATIKGNQEIVKLLKQYGGIE